MPDFNVMNLVNLYSHKQNVPSRIKARVKEDLAALVTKTKQMKG